MSKSESQQQKDRAQTKVESSAAAASHEVGIKQQSKDVSERKNNPRFYDRYTKSDLENSEKWSHLINEYKPWLADDHILSNRRQVYRLERQLLNKVRAQQSVVGASPGARLREKPLLHALAQGVHPELEQVVPLTIAGQRSLNLSDIKEYSEPMDAEERTVMDDVANVATARQAMGVDSAGSEALTAVQTENKTVREDETEESTVASVSGVFD